MGACEQVRTHVEISSVLASMFAEPDGGRYWAREVFPLTIFLVESEYVALELTEMCQCAGRPGAEEEPFGKFFVRI